MSVAPVVTDVPMVKVSLRSHATLRSLRTCGCVCVCVNVHVHVHANVCFLCTYMYACIKFNERECVCVCTGLYYIIILYVLSLW